MLKVRLRKPGKSIKGRRHQKIVVTEKSWARESKFIDELGYYDPGRELLKIDIDKYKKWVEKGAQPSETVASLFKNYHKRKRLAEESKKQQDQETNKKVEETKEQAKQKEPVQEDKKEIPTDDKKAEPEAKPEDTASEKNKESGNQKSS